MVQPDAWSPAAGGGKCEALRMASPTLHIAQDPEADALLSESPLALLTGMLLDQPSD